MNGILIVNKPKEYTSHDVVAIVKKICKEKVGHTGTLDPMATGVLPLLIGEGTKLSEFITNHDKVYEAELKLGEKTETADSEGNVIETKQVKSENLKKLNVERVLQELTGKQQQIPPMYSAIKVNGKKLYEYARENKTVEVPKREIEIYSMELIEIDELQQTISFKVHCSKGTYIRTLCEDIAEKLETVGYMKNLKRIQVGNFKLEQAITLEEIEKNEASQEFLTEKIITIQKFFENEPCIYLPEQKITLLKNGVQLTVKEIDGLYQIKRENNKAKQNNESGKNNLKEFSKKCLKEFGENNLEEFVGIGIVKNGLLKRKLIIE